MDELLEASEKEPIELTIDTYDITGENTNNDVPNLGNKDIVKIEENQPEPAVDVENYTMTNTHKRRHPVTKHKFEAEHLQPEYLIFGRVIKISDEEMKCKRARKAKQYLDKDKLNDEYGNAEKDEYGLFPYLRDSQVHELIFRNIETVPQDVYQTLLSKKLTRIYRKNAIQKLNVVGEYAGEIYDQIDRFIFNKEETRAKMEANEKGIEAGGEKETNDDEMNDCIDTLPMSFDEQVKNLDKKIDEMSTEDQLTEQKIKEYKNLQIQIKNTTDQENNNQPINSIFQRTVLKNIPYQTFEIKNEKQFLEWVSKRQVVEIYKNVNLSILDNSNYVFFGKNLENMKVVALKDDFDEQFTDHNIYASDMTEGYLLGMDEENDDDEDMEEVGDVSEESSSEEDEGSESDDDDAM